MKTYTPSPLNAENITLPDNLTELTEAMARNMHEVWALGRVKEGWKYGETRNDELKTHPAIISRLRVQRYSFYLNCQNFYGYFLLFLLLIGC